MWKELAPLFPPEGFKILLTLFLSFLIGLEREERKGTAGHYVFGGVRTFPLLGLLGYATALISGDQLLPLAFAFAVVGSFLLASYLHKLKASEEAGVTTEISGLLTFVVGILVFRDLFWIASTLVVLSLLLLELKQALEGLSRRLPPEEVITFTKFLLLTVVILPVVPNLPFTPFAVNPFKLWMVVVAVSTVSYGSYVIQKLSRGRGGVLLSAVLGGAYSSTVTTVVLAKKSRGQRLSRLYAGAILLASGLMYLRLVVLVSAFNGALGRKLAPAFLLLSLVAVLGGFLLARMERRARDDQQPAEPSRNPLEFRAAFLFAVVFLFVLVLSEWVFEAMGSAGVRLLALVMGVTDVDPFIMGLTSAAGATTPLEVAAVGIVIAAASNNLAKGAYAFFFADRPTGLPALGLLTLLAAAGLLPLFFLA
jgi:uncharacterized membrane protein (DUF4010 family)